MTLASSSSMQMSYIEETTLGTTPVVGNPTKLRTTGESFTYDIPVEESKEINSTRQITDVIQVDANVAGSMNFELSYGTYDTFFEMLLASAFATDVLTNGVVAQRALSIERHFTDITQFIVSRYMCPSKLDLSFSTGAIVTGSFGFMGGSAQRGATTFMPGTLAAASTTNVMNAVTGVGTILINGSPLSGTYVKTASISVDPALRAQKAIGNLGNVGIGRGTFKVEGSIEVYFANGTLYDIAVANTDLSIVIPVEDAAGNGYTFTFAHARLTVPNPQAGAKDQDVMLTMPFKAIAPGTSDKMISITRAAAT